MPINPNDQGASVSSGSFLTDGMVIAPCSMRTLAAIASGQGEHLVHRAADVVLKERRKLVLVVRESPLNEIHLENMLKLARMGVVILPPMPGFYNHPKSMAEMVDHIVMRILDQFGIHREMSAPAGMERWPFERSGDGGPIGPAGRSLRALRGLLRLSTAETCLRSLCRVH